MTQIVTRTQRISATIFVLLIAVLAFFWSLQVDPGFFARNLLATLYRDLQDHSLTISFVGNVPGQKPFLAVLHFTTGIPVGDLAYLPVGAFLRAIFYFAIIHSITRNKIAASILAFMTAVYPWAGWGYSSVFVHSLGAPLFLAATLVCLIATRRKLYEADFILLILLVFGLHLFDYTAEVWLIIMLLVLALFGVVGQLQDHSSEVVRPSALALLGILGSVFFWTKYTSLTYIRKITQLNPLAAITGYFGSAAGTQYPYQYEPTTSSLGMSTYFYLLALVPIGFYGLTLVYQTLRERTIDFTDSEYVIGAMIIGGSGGTVLYLFMGRFTQYFIFVSLPLVALVCVYFFDQRTSVVSINSSTVTTIFAVSLLIMAGAETTVLVSNDDFSRGSPAAVKPGAEWLFTHSEQPSVLTGLSARGLMRLPEVRNSANANWTVYTPKIYSHLVEGDPLPTDFVAVDFDTKWGTRSTGGWKTFDGLRKHRSNVMANNHLNAVYSSGGFVIYRTNNRTIR
jgi:hypothetical protein